MNTFQNGPLPIKLDFILKHPKCKGKYDKNLDRNDHTYMILIQSGS